jgi:hypothetical protein
MEIYKDTAAGAVRQAIAEASFAVKGDAGRTVDAIISAATVQSRHFALRSVAPRTIPSRTTWPGGLPQSKRSEMSRSRPTGTGANKGIGLQIATPLAAAYSGPVKHRQRNPRNLPQRPAV